MENFVSEVKKRVGCIEDQQFILEKMKLFEESKDRNELERISKELFCYEKKYIPCYAGECDVLICTVGMREAPIILSVLAVKPKKCILLHTKGSYSTVEKIESDQDLMKLGLEFERVEIDEVDAAENYEIMKTQVLNRLGPMRRVRVDPTGGRKIMGTAVGAFAFFFRIPMVYLHAEEKMGINFPFTGRIRDIDNPYVYFGDIELGLIKKSFDNYDFNMVLEICEDLRKTVRNTNINTLLEIIQEFVVVYRDWDMFMHSKHFGDQKSRKEYVILSSGLENAMNKIHRFRKDLKSDIVDYELMQKNIDFLKMLESGWKDRKNICDKYRLVDMYLNANRRAFQNRYDDATARLYRCMEMCSTIELEKYGIDDPAEPDYKMFADRLGMDSSDISSNFEKEMGRSLPPRLALGDQMVLLGHIKNNVVAALYKKMAASKKADKNNPDSLMEKRNRSILAHGTNPICKEDYQQIESNVVSMINATIGKEEFDHLSRQAKFPKLNLV